MYPMSNPTLNWEVIAIAGNIDDVDNWKILHLQMMFP